MEVEKYSGFAFFFVVISMIIFFGKSCVKQVKEYPEGSICARKIDQKADSWQILLDTENLKDSDKMGQELYKSEQTDSADFHRILDTILFAKRYKFARDDIFCFTSDLSGTYSDYTADVEARLKGNQETVCKLNYEEDVMNFLKNRYPCSSQPHK